MSKHHVPPCTTSHFSNNDYKTINMTVSITCQATYWAHFYMSQSLLWSMQYVLEYFFFLLHWVCFCAKESTTFPDSNIWCDVNWITDNTNNSVNLQMLLVYRIIIPLKQTLIWNFYLKDMLISWTWKVRVTEREKSSISWCTPPESCNNQNPSGLKPEGRTGSFSWVSHVCSGPRIISLLCYHADF